MHHHHHDFASPPFDGERGRGRRGMHRGRPVPGPDAGFPDGPAFAGRGPGGFGPAYGPPGGFGPGGFGPGFGPGGRGFRGPRRGRGRGRGDVRAAILLLLAERPRHGYELIQEIAERSSGFWTPSPGSVYPTLQALEDEGLVTLEQVEGRRTASLTDAGRTYVEQNREALGEPWAAVGDMGPALAVRREALALRDAVGQVARVGTPAQHAAAAAALATARKELYRILAEDAAEADAGQDAGA